MKDKNNCFFIMRYFKGTRKKKRKMVLFFFEKRER